MQLSICSSVPDLGFDRLDWAFAECEAVKLMAIWSSIEPGIQNDHPQTW
jgi:hypothetical protein